LLQALGKCRTQHDLVVYTDNPERAQALLGEHCFHYVALGGAGRIKRLLVVLPRLLRRDRIDVAVFQYTAPILGRTKRVVFIHDILPLTHPQYFPFFNRLRVFLFFSISIRQAAIVLVVSEYTRQAVLARYKLPTYSVQTVRNGPSFDREVYKAPCVPAKPLYILTVGRIEARKNVPMLVEAFRKAEVPELRLVVVGAFDLGFEYVFPEDSRIEIRAGVSDEDLITLYRGASLFVYPSAAEGFGLPLLDALLFGLPTISSDRTAMAEIGDGIAAMFDPTADGAADRLAMLIAGHFGGHPVHAPSESQQRDLAERFSWDRAAVDLVAAIESINGLRS
jgi:glycosyltransferase involved in cell wall biosynthesis